MPQVYLVARRQEIQNGSIQITDLFPNQSQFNPTIDPSPQGPFYIRTPDMGISGLGRAILKTLPDNSISFATRSFGLVSYLIRNVEHGNGGALSIAEATASANAVLARVRAGDTLTAVNINALLAVATGNNAGTTLDDGQGGSDSTATVEGILRILAGEKYVVAESVSVQDDNGDFVPVVDHESGFQNDMRRLVPNDSSWQISLAEGQLRGLTTVQDAVNGDFFAGVQSTAPLLTVYQTDGNIYTA